MFANFWRIIFMNLWIGFFPVWFMATIRCRQCTWFKWKLQKQRAVDTKCEMHTTSELKSVAVDIRPEANKPSNRVQPAERIVIGKVCEFFDQSFSMDARFDETMFCGLHTRVPSAVVKLWRKDCCFYILSTVRLIRKLFATQNNSELTKCISKLHGEIEHERRPTTLLLRASVLRNMGMRSDTSHLDLDFINKLENELDMTGSHSDFIV